MFWKELWPTEFRIYRNRGNQHSPEDVQGARIKYDDRPDTHKLKTGERMPAVPKRYSMTKINGDACYHLVEADDDQLVAFRPNFKAGPDIRPSQLHYIQKDGETVAVETEFTGDGELDENKIKNLEIDTTLESDELKKELEENSFNVVNFALLENRDERKTFLAEEIQESEMKYKPSSLIRQYPQLTLTVGAAVAFAIIILATSQEYGQFVPVLKQLSGNMDAINQLANTQAPPGN